ncbi:MAG: hypothetical protein JKP95_02100 [Oceanicaulis sp.]|nr:hypothetical protein [Oceanicaulis sp.]
MADLSGKPRHLALIALSQVLALSVWFAGAAALPALQDTGALTRSLALPLKRGPAWLRAGR